MLNSRKNLKVFALIFILSAFVVTSIAVATVKAQSTGAVDVLVSVGGTTTPDMGSSTNYTDGTVVPLTAIPGDGFVFQTWEIVTAAGGSEDINNPTSITVQAGVTYAVQAVFAPIQFPVGLAPVTNFGTAAIIVMLPTVGGTTFPVAGTYAINNVASLNINATADTGFTFSHWVIGGAPLTGHGGYAFTDTPTSNPYNINHGYGNTYTYQAVFTPTSSSSSPTVPEYSSAAVIATALALVAIAFGTYAYKRKTK